MGVVDLESLSRAGEQGGLNSKKKAFIKGANMSERSNLNKGGRPKVEIKADKAMTVYFTEAEKKQVQNYCSHISFSSLVKQLLEEKGILTKSCD